MRKFNIELGVGIFVLIGVLCLAYISVKLGKLEVLGRGHYAVYADFEKAGGIKPGSSIEIAGVEVGRVKRVTLNPEYQAKVEMSIRNDVQIQDDAIASIKTKGLIGEKFIQITPGGSERLLSEGGRIRETESAVDLEELISKYVFGKV